MSGSLATEDGLDIVSLRKRWHMRRGSRGDSGGVLPACRCHCPRRRSPPRGNDRRFHGPGRRRRCAAGRLAFLRETRDLLPGSLDTGHAGVVPGSGTAPSRPTTHSPRSNQFETNHRRRGRTQSEPPSGHGYSASQPWQSAFLAAASSLVQDTCVVSILTMIEATRRPFAVAQTMLR